MAQATNTTEGEIILSGDLTGDANAPELRASGVTPGTYAPVQRLSVDSKGRVTSVGQVTIEDLLPFVPLATASVPGFFSTGAGVSVVDGALVASPPNATSTQKGVVQIDTSVSNWLGLDITAGSISASKLASTDEFGLIISGSGTRMISEDLIVTETSAAFSSVPGKNKFSASWVSGPPDAFEQFAAAINVSPTYVQAENFTTTSTSMICSAEVSNANVQFSDNTFKSEHTLAGLSSSGTFLPITLGYGDSKYAFPAQLNLGGLTSSNYVSATTTTGLIATTQVSASLFRHFPSVVSYGNGKFVGIGVNATVGQQYVYSSDGVTWFTGTGPGNSSNQNLPDSMIVWNGTLFVSSISLSFRAMIYSYDGISWAGASMSGPISSTAPKSFAWNGTSFFGRNISDPVNYSYSSTNGTSWVSSTTAVFPAKTSTSGSVGLVSNIGTNFVAVSSIGTSTFDSFVSANGVSWTKYAITASTAANAALFRVISTGSKILALFKTASKIFASTSTDGISWSSITDTGLDFVFASDFLSTGTNGSNFLMMLANGNTSVKTAISSDGLNWKSGSTIPLQANLAFADPSGSEVIEVQFDTGRDITLVLPPNAKLEGGATLTCPAGKTLTLQAVASGDDWLVTTEQ